MMIPGNKLQKYGNVLQNDGKKLKSEEGNLKILGNGSIFVEIIRKNEIAGRLGTRFQFRMGC